MNPIKDVVIVGGGTAGLIAALYLKSHYKEYNIKIVKSSKINIIGVGEGSTEHWAQFMRDVGIDPIELINETKATIKIGILFNDWNYPGSTYVHSIIAGPAGISHRTTTELYNRLVINNPTKDPYVLNPLFKKIYEKNIITHDQSLTPSNQYHFDTYKLNEYLIKKCLEREIIIEEAFIKNVKLDEKGYIKSLVTSTNSLINGDFFIDCSGFKKVLSSKLNVKWKSYTDYLPVNQAITLATDLDLKKGIEPYTKTTALSSGWAWKIPTQERYGNGYVFDNRYIDSDNALNEFNQHLGINAEEVAKDIKFEAGKVDKFWEKNCVSIGLAGSFIEPLEAQSIGFSIIQSRFLIEYINSWPYDKLNISQDYNKRTNDTFDNALNYVQVHYLTQRNDSKFWKEKPFKLTDFNKKTLKRFSLGLFTPSDFITDGMFDILNFYQVYYGLDLLNLPQIKKIMDSYSSNFINEWDNHFKEYINSNTQNIFFTTHIDYLKLVKENYSS